MIVAAILGDAVNYHIGSWAGRKYLSVGKIPFVRQDHLQRTHKYFDKHGGKTIIFARFIPIVRTYAPFVAGAAGMPYSRFAIFNVVGAFCWIGSLAPLGYYFGNRPWVRNNFELVVLAIIIISILPAVIEFIRMRRESSALAGPESPSSSLASGPSSGELP
jgi:membrane-associated protein